MTWAFILLTIAAIVLGVVVVRNALLATQPGAEGPTTGMSRPGVVDRTPAPVALVTDLTWNGKAPGASGGGTSCPLS